MRTFREVVEDDHSSYRADCARCCPCEHPDGSGTGFMDEHDAKTLLDLGVAAFFGAVFVFVLWVAGEIDGITAVVLVLFGAFVAALVKIRRD